MLKGNRFLLLQSLLWPTLLAASFLLLVECADDHVKTPPFGWVVFAHAGGKRLDKDESKSSWRPAVPWRVDFKAVRPVTLLWLTGVLSGGSSFVTTLFDSTSTSRKLYGLLISQWNDSTVYLYKLHKTKLDGVWFLFCFPFANVGK